MWLSALSTTFFALTCVIQSIALETRDLLQDLQDQALQALAEAESNGTIAKRAGCSILSAAIRKGW
jgi:tyrosinase